MTHEVYTEVVQKKYALEKVTCDGCGKILKIGPGFIWPNGIAKNPPYNRVFRVHVDLYYKDPDESDEEYDYCEGCFTNVGIPMVATIMGAYEAPNIEITKDFDHLPEGLYQN